MQPLVLGKPGESLSLSAISHEMNDLSTSGKISNGNSMVLEHLTLFKVNDSSGGREKAVLRKGSFFWKPGHE